MFKKALIVGLASVSLFAVGCGGNACDDAVDRVKAKYEECDIDLPDESDEGEDVECTDELAEQYEAAADAIEDADCESLGG